MDKYECCFCGESIKEKVTALLAVTNWNEDENSENQESQQLFCHFNCLKKNLVDSKRLYIDEE